MSGIAILVDLLRKNPSFSTQTLHSHGSAIAASAAAATGTTLASRFLFGDGGKSFAFADVGAEWSADYIPNLRTASESIFRSDSIQYSTKVYPIELKPLFSAFGLKSLAMTSLRSFLMFYLPLLEPKANIDDFDDDDDDVFPSDASEEQHVDLVVPLKKSVKQIIRETSVVTTRRILERLAVHYVSQRMAWKLLKDVPRSARRKAERGMPKFVYFYSVSKTTFRGHLLGVAASWLVQVGIEIYRCISTLTKRKNEPTADDEVNTAEQIHLLGKRVSGATVRCGASLIFASVGAGIGAALIHPSMGQWIGCAVGDLAGPILITICLEKVFQLDL
ncbi:hypothetical protein Scep_028958 [Stephania cephalantha]|uniref:Uncharacterized protein n=1 Tax=Stephania cephalantha TaxID=152367 RepID=A0AAP0EAW2_9MAGN